MKVYVITRGEYSDYHICAVTLDKERAERLKVIYSSYLEDAEIEVFDTESDKDESGLVPYKVERPDSSEPEITRISCEDFGWDCPGFGEVNVWAKDEAHALKIARDKLAKYKAEKEGL